MTADMDIARATGSAARHDDKMNAVARVAAGVTQGIGSAADSAAITLAALLQELPTEHRAYDRLEDLRESVRRIASVARQLGAFTRPVSGSASTDLNAVVHRTRPLLERLAGPVVAVAFHEHESPLWIRADAASVEQMLFHAIVNARDAMPEGGAVRLATSRRTIPFAFEHQHGVLPAGEWVTLTIGDSGYGMTPDVLERAFEPFFTTREPGLGTGLGLSTVFATMRQVGGHVMLESEPGRGATLTLVWPLITRAPARVAQDVTPGDAAVLVADADPWVRTVAGRVLRRAGFGVLEAGSAGSAISVLRGVAGRSVGVVVADIALRGHGGVLLIDQLRDEFSQVPVVPLNNGRPGAAAAVVEPLLSKPFTQTELLNAVQSRLR